MGLLSKGTPLSWQEIQHWCHHVHHHGALQFLHMFRRASAARRRHPLLWGDEIEYTLVQYDAGKVRLLLSSHHLLQRLEDSGGEERGDDALANYSIWHPEFADYMVEGIPRQPYASALAYVNTVEANMAARRQRVKAQLRAGESIVTTTTFPRLGCKDFTYPPTHATPDRGYTRSLFFPDVAISRDNAKFVVVAQHCRQRIGHKPHINIPIYKDVNVNTPFNNNDLAQEKVMLADHIYADCLGFGGGSCSVQVTIQAVDLEEARYLYDQLAVVCPVLLALSAATPVFRGYLTDVDTRWRAFKQAADIRTEEEKRPCEEASECGVLHLCQSRCDTVNWYISPEGQKYNDLAISYNSHVLNLLLSKGGELGLDEALAKHVAHVFIWDPLFLLSGEIYQDDELDNEHFENIQSTNWQTMRLKPPPQRSQDLGWRVEFRPCDLQITDFENAALVTFVLLLSRALVSFKINLLMPISMVVENMEVAEERDAVRKSKFWCRTKSHVLGEDDTDHGGEFERLSIDEVMCGRDGVFPGLVPLVRCYLEHVDVDVDTMFTIMQYLQLLEDRASGKTPTGATWMREFITSHDQYHRDSAVSDAIAHDLVMTIDRLAEYSSGVVPVTGKSRDVGRHHDRLLGALRSRSKLDVPVGVASLAPDDDNAAHHMDHVQSCMF